MESLFEKIDLPIEDPLFHQKMFDLLCKENRKKLKKLSGPIERIMSEDFYRFSRRLDEADIQESCSARNVAKARILATYLIDDDGELDLALVKKAKESLEQSCASLGPGRQYDALRNRHMIDVLEQFVEDKALVRQLKIVSKPHSHRYAEDVLRNTLQLDSGTLITDAHARRAALAALLTYLRQNVGSCFATAPAIVIHTEQRQIFLKDIQELLSTGQLKRTFGGMEYAVPFSYSWGAGDLRRGFVCQTGVIQDDLNLWYSPGLLEALESVGIIDKRLSLKKKTAQAKKMIISTLEGWGTSHPWFFLSIEDLLKRLLLNHLGITPKELEEYLLRPTGMIYGGLFLSASEQQTSSGTSGSCSRFLELFVRAKDAFKVIADNALLKSWEFTLASFAETKAQFTTWNLYTSLGLRPEDKGGIGPSLYEILKRKLEECNEKVHQLQYDYEQVYNHLQYVQRRLRRAASEEEAKWLKIEYQTKSHEFQTIEEMRNGYSHKARRYANLYDGLVDLYFRLFPNYFQEVYDADILEVTAVPFDDSPAGFRLLYKHGRSNTSQWTRVNNHVEFIDALADFFVASERELLNAPEMEGLEEDLGEIVTAIVGHIRSEEFIETAFHRMAAAHQKPLIKNPLENLDKVEKKPWVYTSGGAMNTLVSCYFRLDGNPKEASRWVENPAELATFFIDTVKGLPNQVLEGFVENSEKNLLIHSPTHAFLLKPGYSLFREGWESKQFTYTWVRDTLVQPMEWFVDKIYLDSDRMQYVIDQLSPMVPINFRHYFRESLSGLGGSMQVCDFRQHILHTIQLSQGLQYGGRGVLSSDQIDSTLYSLLPLFPSYKLKERVEKILNQLPGLNQEVIKKLLGQVEKFSGRFGASGTMGAQGLQSVVKALVAAGLERTMTSIDYPLLVSQIAQKEGFALPAPLIFADTNWVKDFFAFLVNPGTGYFELWRVDYTGSVGAPMSDWKQWVDGSKQKPDWGVYTNPYEYTF